MLAVVLVVNSTRGTTVEEGHPQAPMRLAGLLLGAALPALPAASPAASLAVSYDIHCRTQFQAVQRDHVYNAPTEGAQLSWMTDASVIPKGETQQAYELEVRKGTTAVWSSGKVASAAQTLAGGIPAAAKLAAASTYSWRVRLWLSSEPAAATGWGCGPDGAGFDTAPAASVFPGENKWLGGGGQVRAKAPMALPAGKVSRARAFVTGMGAFYLYINGEPVGNLRAGEKAVNVMDPPQTVYSKTILFSAFDIGSMLKPGADNHVGVLLGNYKWGYTDQWASMSKAGGPDGMRCTMMLIEVDMEDGSTHTLSTDSAENWEVRKGPVLWDHFFHGETYDGSLDPAWNATGTDSQFPAGHDQAWAPSVEIAPEATAPKGMEVIGADGKAIALGTVKPNVSPALAVTGVFPALSVTKVEAADTGASSYVFDFGRESTHLPPYHRLISLLSLL